MKIDIEVIFIELDEINDRMEKMVAESTPHPKSKGSEK